MAYQNFFRPIFLFLFFKIDRYQEYHVNRPKNKRDDALKISELKNHSKFKKNGLLPRLGKFRTAAYLISPYNTVPGSQIRSEEFFLVSTTGAILLDAHA